MQWLRMLTSNYFINMGLLCWMVAQILKVLLTLATTRKFVPERLLGAGGMPSSHSALVCGVATAVFLRYGFSSVEFAIVLVLGLIVMYDAMGVRRAAGEQAKTLNQLMGLFGIDENNDGPQVKKLKEFIGHTPIEVISGGILGIALVLLASW